MSDSRVITPSGEEEWSMYSVMKIDLPILKREGYKFASFFEGNECGCFVCGWKQRARAVDHAIRNSGVAFDLNNNKRIY